MYLAYSEDAQQRIRAAAEECFRDVESRAGEGLPDLLKFQGFSGLGAKLVLSNPRARRRMLRLFGHQDLIFSSDEHVLEDAIRIAGCLCAFNPVKAMIAQRDLRTLFDWIKPEYYPSLLHIPVASKDLPNRTHFNSRQAAADGMACYADWRREIPATLDLPITVDADVVPLAEGRQIYRAALKFVLGV